jgi:DNA repair protein RadC
MDALEKKDNQQSIKHWADDDKPREKMMLKGRAALSDAELIAILLGSGTVDLSAVDVAKQLMNAAQNNLNQLAKLGLKDLKKIKGIGEAKAITILAAMELGRRRKEADVLEKVQITSSMAAYNEMKQHLLDLPHEEFWIILLNRRNEVIQKVQISSGGVAGTVADPKMIFKAALEQLASGVILVHNHPSGNKQPSQADIDLTKRMRDAGKLLDTPVLDHLIFTDKGFYSFADEDRL